MHGKDPMSRESVGKTFSFEVCSQCKLMCCQGANPPLTLKRKKIIEDFLRKKGVSPENMFVDEGYSHPTTDSEDYCKLYDKRSGKCLVHAVKPETCVAGPITFDINLKTGKVEWFLKKSSICAFAKKLYENDEKFKTHLEAAKPEIMRLICELDAGALATILRIPEPETFKVDENELPKEVRKKLGIARLP